ncbi:MAG: CaiB/BaiF CoA transferase family protein [Hyphomicrobiales bacterium]
MAGALDGIRILDLSRVFAGPGATQVLGDLGADVIKVEEPRRGDEARYFGLTEAGLERYGGMGPSFLALNRNKRSLALDLANAAGRKLAFELASRSDVVLHNFRIGAMKRWGLDYEALRAVDPRIIYCEFSSYGLTGPLSHIGANDLALQAQSGLMSLTGEPGRRPVRVGTAAIDLHGSISLVAAILAALYHRERTGEGQVVETSLLLSSAHLMNYFYTEYWIDGTVRKPMGTANHLSVPNQVFPTADGSVVIIAPSNEMWARCARALDPERLDLPRWRTIRERLAARNEIVEAISAITRKMPAQEVVAQLSAAKVNVAKVNSVGEAADHPQLAAIGGVVEAPMPGGAAKTVSSPFKMMGTPMTVRHGPPALGAHTDEILSEFGFGTSEIASLRDQGAFGAIGEG